MKYFIIIINKLKYFKLNIKCRNVCGLNQTLSLIYLLSTKFSISAKFILSQLT